MIYLHGLLYGAGIGLIWAVMFQLFRQLGWYLSYLAIEKGPEIWQRLRSRRSVP